MSKEEVIMSFPEPTYSAGSFLLIGVGLSILLMLVLLGIGLLIGGHQGASVGAVVALFIVLLAGPIYASHLKGEDAKALDAWENQFYYEYVESLPVEKYGIYDYTKIGGQYTIKLVSGNPISEVVVDNVLFDAPDNEAYVEAKYAGLRGSEFANYNRYEDVVVHMPEAAKVGTTSAIK